MRKTNYDKWWSAAFDLMDIVVFILDEENNIIRVNKSFCGFIGKEERDCLGKKCYQLVHQTEICPEACPAKIMFQSKKTEALEFYDTKRKVWLRSQVTPLLDEDNELVGVLHIVGDISAQKHAGEIIVQQNEFLKRLLDSLSYPLYVIDANDYTVRLANSVAGFGDLSDAPKCYQLTHKCDKPCTGLDICPLDEVKRTKKAALTEHIHFDKNGNQRFVEVHGYPVFDKSGKRLFKSSSIRSISRNVSVWRMK